MVVYKATDIEGIITYISMAISFIIGLFVVKWSVKKRKFIFMTVFLIIFGFIIPPGLFFWNRANNTPLQVNISDDSLKIKYKRGNIKEVPFRDFQTVKIYTKVSLLGNKYKEFLITYSEQKKELLLNTKYFKDAAKIEKKLEDNAGLKENDK